jgi:N-acetylglutamate synthase-like GNAT family acetyltransferase
VSAQEATHRLAVYKITTARPNDLLLLPAIELAAAKLLVGHAPESVLAETTNESELQSALNQGQLWVALAENEPVGFAHVEVFDSGVAHLKELDVHPDHGRRGVGTRLVLAVCTWAANAGFQSVTLTTFRDVAWNMPFYTKLGFEEIATTDLNPTLQSILQSEIDRGLDGARRVAMRHVCPVFGR